MSKIDAADRLAPEYLDSIFATDILTAEREVALVNRWRDDSDEAALQELVSAHARLAVKIASRYKKFGLPLPDLVQEGNIGLMEAAMRFDLKHDVRFATYAMWWIKASIQQYLLAHWSLVKFVTTNDRKRIFFRLNAIRNKLGINPSLRLTNEESAKIAETLGVTQKDVAIMDNRLSARDNSLNESVRHDNAALEFQDLLVDDGPSPEQIASAAIDQEAARKIILQAMSHLSEREQRIITARRMQDDPVTLEELSKQYGVSRERIRQIEKRGLERLRDIITTHFRSEDIVPD